MQVIRDFLPAIQNSHCVTPRAASWAAQSLSYLVPLPRIGGWLVLKVRRDEGSLNLQRQTHQNKAHAVSSSISGLNPTLAEAVR